MIPIPIEGPAVEPVSVPDMRAYLRLDDGAEDDLVAALVKAARLSVEALAGRVMIDSLWRIALDGWLESRVIPLPARRCSRSSACACSTGTGRRRTCRTAFIKPTP